MRPDRLALVICLLAGGCSAVSRSVTGAEAGRGAGWERVDDVPMVRQSSQDGCGAAALAMVLGRWGHPVTQEEIWETSPPPPGQGLRAAALRDFARGRGLRAFLVEGQPDDLYREVGRERPVLVGVMRRQGRRVYPHYEVVVGIDRRRDRILVLDPARGPRETSLERFGAEWAAAGRLTLVVYPPATAATPAVAREAPP